LSMAAAMLAFSGLGATAERLENQVAVFSALDKVTARISKFEVEINKTVAFGNIKVTPRVCYSRPPTELPKTTTFVEVDETGQDGTEKRIFTGWMFAESPGIFGVEHPTIDVWLTECSKPRRPVAQTAPVPAQTEDAGGAAQAADDPWAAEATAAEGEPPAETPRRRVRR